MIHHKQTSRKNEWITIKNGNCDEITIDFGNDGMKPIISIHEGKHSEDQDVAWFIVNDKKNIDELFEAIKIFRKRYYDRKKGFTRNQLFKEFKKII